MTICVMKRHNLLKKSHKTVNLYNKKSQAIVKKPKKTVNLCDKKSQHSEKKSQSYKFLW